MSKSFFVPDLVKSEDCHECGGILSGNTCDLCVEDGITLDVSITSNKLIMEGIFHTYNQPEEGQLNPIAVKKLVGEANAADLAFDSVYEKIENCELTLIECGRDEKTIQGYLDTLNRMSDLAIAHNQPIFYG